MLNVASVKVLEITALLVGVCRTIIVTVSVGRMTYGSPCASVTDNVIVALSPRMIEMLLLTTLYKKSPHFKVSFFFLFPLVRDSVPVLVYQAFADEADGGYKRRPRQGLEQHIHGRQIHLALEGPKPHPSRQI